MSGPPLSLAELAERARAAGPRPVVLIDGGAGAGKSTLARSLLPLLATEAGPAQLVSLDDVYPGWDGLATGARALAEEILRETDPGWWRWDWTTGRRAEWHPVDPRRPLLVEGCGALSRATRARAALGIWLEVDAAVRKQRALARDGDVFSPHWDRWAAQEAAWRRQEPPHTLADIVLDDAALDRLLGDEADAVGAER